MQAAQLKTEEQTVTINPDVVPAYRVKFEVKDLRTEEGAEMEIVAGETVEHIELVHAFLLFLSGMYGYDVRPYYKPVDPEQVLGIAGAAND